MNLLRLFASHNLTLLAIWNPDGSVNYDRFFQVLDQLIARARKDHAGKK